MDGVLVDTCGCHARAYQGLWDRCGIASPPYAAIAGRPTTEVVAQYAGAVRSSPGLIAEWVAFKQQRAREYMRTGPVAYDDVLPTFEAIERAGIGMGVATGASRAT